MPSACDTIFIGTHKYAITSRDSVNLAHGCIEPIRTCRLSRHFCAREGIKCCGRTASMQRRQEDNNSTSIMKLFLVAVVVVLFSCEARAKLKEGDCEGILK